MPLDQYFDYNTAKQALETIITTRSAPYKQHKDLSDQHLRYLKTDNIGVQQTGTKRKLYKLGVLNEDGQIDSELVLRIEGILSSVELVPGNVSKHNTNKAAMLSQRVQLVGAGSQAFEDAVGKTIVTRDVFARFFSGYHCNDWNVGRANDLFINASSHFFTATGENPGATHIPFANTVDPMGIATALVEKSNGALIHTEDNIVQYFKKDDADNDTEQDTYYQTFPAEFKAGDIVEVCGTLVAFLKKNNEVKLHFHLLTITLLDATFSKSAEEARFKDLLLKRPVPNILRRRYPYAEEDRQVEGARKKFKTLSITQPDVHQMEQV